MLNFATHLTGRISTHAPRVGSDRLALAHFVDSHNFNSRSPCGERQEEMERLMADAEFQLTLPVWGATSTRRSHHPGPTISTHAPRVGSDVPLC